MQIGKKTLSKVLNTSIEDLRKEPWYFPIDVVCWGPHPHEETQNMGVLQNSEQDNYNSSNDASNDDSSVTSPRRKTEKQKAAAARRRAKKKVVITFTS